MEKLVNYILLKELLRKNKITYFDLSKVIGVDHKCVENWFNNNNIPYYRLLQITDLKQLRLNRDDILGFKFSINKVNNSAISSCDTELSFILKTISSSLSQLLTANNKRYKKVNNQKQGIKSVIKMELCRLIGSENLTKKQILLLGEMIGVNIVIFPFIRTVIGEASSVLTTLYQTGTHSIMLVNGDFESKDVFNNILYSLLTFMTKNLNNETKAEIKELCLEILIDDEFSPQHHTSILDFVQKKIEESYLSENTYEVLFNKDKIGDNSII